MKKLSDLKIGIGIPSPDTVNPDFAIGNLSEIVAYTKKHVTENVFIRFQRGVRTDKNRNAILKDFLEEKVDFILWLDADMIFPADIAERYIVDHRNIEKADFDVIGCLYFKRSHPYSPIGYVKSDDPLHPFRPMLPQRIEKGKIYHCDGLGFGGMMVNARVYEGMGKSKWMVYGKNFHIPEEMKHQLTHDLEFCKEVAKRNFTIKLHGSVRPGHIGEMIITEKDYIEMEEYELLRWPKVLAIMPTTDLDMAEKTARLLKGRAGEQLDLVIVEDKKREGFVKLFNTAFKELNTYELYIYTAQDVFVSKNWLVEAVQTATKYGAGLVGFNDGKWNGRLAQFGMLDRLWVEKNIGKPFHDGYFGNYCDVELTQIAKQYGKFAHSDKSLMIEVDYEKDFRDRDSDEFVKDKELYKKRAKDGFDGQVVDENLKKEFL